MSLTFVTGRSFSWVKLEILSFIIPALWADKVTLEPKHNVLFDLFFGQIALCWGPFYNEISISTKYKLIEKQYCYEGYCWLIPWGGIKWSQFSNFQVRRYYPPPTKYTFLCRFAWIRTSKKKCENAPTLSMWLWEIVM